MSKVLLTTAAAALAVSTLDLLQKSEGMTLKMLTH